MLLAPPEAWLFFAASTALSVGSYYLAYGCNAAAASTCWRPQPAASAFCIVPPPKEKRPRWRKGKGGYGQLSSVAEGGEGAPPAEDCGVYASDAHDEAQQHESRMPHSGGAGGGGSTLGSIAVDATVDAAVDGGIAGGVAVATDGKAGINGGGGNGNGTAGVELMRHGNVHATGQRTDH